jgi:deoxycytidylate deaminase
MKKPPDAKDLARDILSRSSCSVQVGAAISDDVGIFSWGWNSVGFTGLGLHAEAHAILRANKQRLFGSTIYVASKRKRNGKTVVSKPCEDCQKLIQKWNIGVKWRDNNGEWKTGY